MMMEGENERGIPVDVEFDSIGFTGQIVDDGEGGEGPGKPRPPREGGKQRPRTEHDLLEMLRQLNAGEEMKAEEIMLWRQDIYDFFEQLKRNEKLASMMSDDNFTREDKQREYNKSVRRYLHSVDSRPEGELFQPQLFKTMVDANRDQFFFMFSDYLAGGDVYDYYQPEDTLQPLIPFDDVVYEHSTEGGPVVKHKQPHWRNVAICVRQPFATLLCSGIKDIENRKYSTDYRGRLFITTGVNDYINDVLNDPNYDMLVAPYVERGIIPPLESLQKSALIGYVDLVDCVLEPVNSFWSRGAWADGHNVNWIIKNAYIFDEPQMVGTKWMLNLFDIPELDPDNLPPAHKVEF